MDIATGKKRQLSDAYRFEGFRPQEGKMRGIFGKPQARILPLTRRSKKHAAGSVAPYNADGMTASPSGYGTCPAGTCMCSLRLNAGAWTAGNAVR